MALADEKSSRILKDVESTFFQLLHRLDEVLNSIEHEYKEVADRDGSVATGRQAFRDLYKRELKERYRELTTGDRDEKSEAELAIALDQKMYRNKTHIFGIYLRSLYHVFKFIDTSSLTFAQKARYAILRVRNFLRTKRRFSSITVCGVKD